LANLYLYATILKIVQDALVSMNQTSPAGVYDSQDGNAVMMGSLANQVGPLLTDIYSWQQFNATFTVTGNGITTDFPLPSGLSRFIGNTGWSVTNRRPVQIVSDSEAAAVAAWIGNTPFLSPACRVVDDVMRFVSAPANLESITFQYVSRNWVLDADTVTEKEELTANLDKPRHDSLLFTFALKLKWAQVRGLASAQFQQDFNDRFSQITTRNQMANTLVIGGGVRAGATRFLNGGNVPDTGFGN